MHRMGMRIISQSPEHTVIEMPISGNTQPQGLLHGGASAALAETAASHSAILHAQRLFGENAVAVGVELNISHLKAGRGLLIRATAEALHLGRSSTVHTTSSSPLRAYPTGFSTSKKGAGITRAHSTIEGS